MKPLIKLSMLVCLLSAAANSYSQDLPQARDQVIHDEISNMLLNANDTVILFTVEVRGGSIPSSIHIKGLGIVRVLDQYYLLFENAGKSFLNKYFLYYDKMDRQRIARSEVLAIGDARLYDSLTSSLAKIEDEMIHPFVSKTKSTNTYDYTVSPHSYRCTIEVFTSKDSWSKSIDEFHLRENTCRGCPYDAINLNYTYNTGTHLYQLYNNFRTLIEKLDDLFVFVKN
jgi:hypothetical protein